MKILIVHNHYREHGGEDQAVNVERRMLEDSGHQVIMYERFNKEFEQMPLNRQMGVYFKESLWSQQTYTDIKNLIARERPDVAHFHNIFFMVSLSAYQACFEAGVPVFQTLHNYRFLCANGIFYRDGRICEDCLNGTTVCAVIHRCWKNSYLGSYFMIRIIHALKRRNILNRIHRFVAPSEFTRQKYMDAGFPGDKITVVPHFLEKDPEFSGSAGEYALYAGTLREYKGIRNLIQAWAEGSDLPLKVIGDGPLRAEIEKMIKDNDWKNIEVLGPQDHSRVLEYIQKAFLVVVPSLCYETFAQVMMEAYACGVPVLASRIGAVTELVDEGKTGFLYDAHNSSDLLAKIRDLQKDIPRLRNMRRDARNKFESFYRNRKSLLNLFAECVHTCAV